MPDALFAQPGKLTKLALTAMVASASLAGLAAMASPVNRYYMVDELVASDLSKAPSELKVHGWVLRGTITTETFVLHKSGKKLRVFHQGPLPDTVRDQSELVVTGSVVPAEDLEVTIESDMPYVFVASEVSGKCATKYDSDSVNLKYE